MATAAARTTTTAGARTLLGLLTRSGRPPIEKPFSAYCAPAWRLRHLDEAEAAGRPVSRSVGSATDSTAPWREQFSTAASSAEKAGCPHRSGHSNIL
jgi:hypothetical protein